jgi:hypothetical protein
LSPFRLFGPRPITEEVRTEEKLPGLSGPSTAREALAAIMPAVRKIDSDHKFSLVASGEDIDQQGYAFLWEFFFHFPRRQARGIFSVQPTDVAAMDKGCDLCLKVDLKPIYTGTAAQVRKRLKDDRDAIAYLRKIWDESEQEKQALPLTFRDSPEAVRSLAEQGVNWSAGDTSLTLSSKVLPSGEIVWCTYSYGKEFHTPFALEK